MLFPSTRSLLTFTIIILYYYLSIKTAFYPLHLPLRNYSKLLRNYSVVYYSTAAVAAARVDRRPLQQNRRSRLGLQEIERGSRNGWIRGVYPISCWRRLSLTKSRGGGGKIQFNIRSFKVGGGGEQNKLNNIVKNKKLS